MDEFQIEAIDAIEQGQSVVVSAPTGSGKTVIGEYAIYRAISHKQRVFYTTPLKALSNQKLHDFRRQFGVENVGLMTGDMSLNRDAAVVVMTTEIFRNMLYASNENDDPLTNVEAVVLDECHYMNDSQRGTVWEESIIHSPKSLQILALSATIANSGQLTDWIQKVHGPVKLVSSNFRPVPLSFNFCSAKGLHPLLNKEGTGLHPNCKVWRSPKGQKRKGRSPKPIQPKSPPIGFVVSSMADKDMLPAIYFIFSRRGCDKAIKDLSNICLLNIKEKEDVRLAFNKYRKLNPDAIREGIHSDALFRGFAAHHAGVLPAWKELIEDLFQKGLLKVVFATETLAAGINMPARTTVISSLSKRTDIGHRPLMGSEFLQMAGRAGRRGLDSRGYVVTVQSRFEGVREAGQIATSSPDPLISQFSPSYGMVLNLLNSYKIEKAKELIERSFGSYLASLDFFEEEDLIQQLITQLNSLKGLAGDVPWSEFEAYEKLKSRLKEERRLLRILQKQAAETLANELTMALQFASLGTLISLKAPQLQSKITPAVIVNKIDGPGQFPLLLCLTSENIWTLVTCQSVVSLHAELSCLEISNFSQPNLTKAGALCYGDSETSKLALAILEVSSRYDMKTPQYDLAGEVLAQAELVSGLEFELEKQPAHLWGDRKKLKKHRRMMEELDIEINERKQFLDHRANQHWETFLSLIEILRHFTCLDCLKLTEMGRTVASLRGDNQLWLGLVLMSGYLDELRPSELAAVFQAISTEIKRPDLWSGYPTPPQAQQVLQDLLSLQREVILEQERYGISEPVYIDPDLMGLVDSWARGNSWRELISNTSLDEGDVVRILRRTVDLLSQVPYCELISEQLRTNARKALNSINRFPVCESEDLMREIEVEEQSLNPATKRIL